VREEKVYDVIILGGGPGGYVAAIRAAQLGLQTAIVEREALGGICLNWGCVPTKALLRNAELMHILQHRQQEFGFSFDHFQADYGVAVARSRQVSQRLVKGVAFLMRKNKVDVYEGNGKLLSPTQLAVTDAKGITQVLTTRHIIVATGARPRAIPGMEVDGKTVVTYRQAIVQKELPKAAIIIGAGAIGVEFGYIWHHYGVDVTIVEMLPRVVPLEDEEISKELARAFRKLKIKVRTDSKVTHLQTDENGARVTIAGPDGATETLTAGEVLVSIGVQPNSDGIGLEALGVRTERGYIVIDDKMRTNVPGIYAVGDVTGKVMLAHVAQAQGIVATESIAGVKTVVLDYEMMPHATYTQPQIASFGLTEAQAKERGYEINVGKFPFQANGKALGLGDYQGFVKIIADKRYGEILGAHMIGPEVTELLPELTLARAWELTANEIARNVHAHPTLSEALMEAAHAVEGKAIHI